MQELKRNSWIFKIAYGINPSRAPESISVCKLFWRTTHMLFIWWPLICLFCTLATVICVFGFGQRFPFFKNDILNGWALVDIKFWPKIFGYRVMPLPIAAVCMGIFSTHKLVSELFGILGVLIGKDLGFYIFTGLLLTVVLFFLGRWVVNTEYGIMFREHVQNVKRNFCPIVTIRKN